MALHHIGIAALKIFLQVTQVKLNKVGLQFVVLHWYFLVLWFFGKVCLLIQLCKG